ncbi:Nucleotidyl transferase [Arcobacter nitrofigilis DSM 7299]|uniref:Nucleotidyl transferase n=1 Tax=Arcobacter nitrofigilis (strain ATCC 33309 / DSM 7299 / CCUG 15893 / LMG 7604 / NCTC 12251 / CI) TaxID=572480 RepID=D5V7F2_ARCNC|nr:nucleotidyltransferase family protein [Arcobacter nitrofigilis]ADG94572.1 Nucleotidyl transferase [Arcobacter nitrofigilis DSM 7299]
MEAIILAGGFGTRLQTIVKDVPKPMAPINEKPFLEYIFNYLSKYAIKHIILSVGYKKEIIQEYFKKEFNNIKITYSIEDEPLGTGGAIKKALECVKGNKSFVLNGDTLFNIDLNEFTESSKNNKISIALKEMKNIERYGSIEVNENNTITSFKEKQFFKKAFINGGIYLLYKDIFINYNKDIFSFENFLENNFKNLNAKGILFNDSYFIDIGIPTDYKKAEIDFKELF